MAEDEVPEQNTVQRARVFPVTTVSTVDDFTARTAVQEKVTAVLFLSPDCNLSTKEALPAYEALSVDPEVENSVSFLLVNTSSADAAILKSCNVFALPAVHFFYNGDLIEGFSGNNSDKMKLMAKNAVVRRVELIAAKEEEAKAAAAAAAEAAAAAAAAE